MNQFFVPLATSIVVSFSNKLNTGIGAIDVDVGLKSKIGEETTSNANRVLIGYVDLISPNVWNDSQKKWDLRRIFAN